MTAAVYRFSDFRVGLEDAVEPKRAMSDCELTVSMIEAKLLHINDTNRVRLIQTLSILKDCYIALRRWKDAIDCGELALEAYAEVIEQSLENPLIRKNALLNLESPQKYTLPISKALRKNKHTRMATQLKRYSQSLESQWTILSRPSHP